MIGSFDMKRCSIKVRCQGNGNKREKEERRETCPPRHDNQACGVESERACMRLGFKCLGRVECCDVPRQPFEITFQPYVRQILGRSFNPFPAVSPTGLGTDTSFTEQPSKPRSNEGHLPTPFECGVRRGAPCFVSRDTYFRPPVQSRATRLALSSSRASSLHCTLTVEETIPQEATQQWIFTISAYRTTSRYTIQWLSYGLKSRPCHLGIPPGLLERSPTITLFEHGMDFELTWPASHLPFVYLPTIYGLTQNGARRRFGPLSLKCCIFANMRNL